MLKVTVLQAKVSHHLLYLNETSECDEVVFFKSATSFYANVFIVQNIFSHFKIFLTILNGRINR